MEERSTTNAIERLHEEFKRRIKTQTVLPSAETAAMLFWACSPRVRSPCAKSTDGTRPPRNSPISRLTLLPDPDPHPPETAPIKFQHKSRRHPRTIASFLLSHNRYDTDRQIPIEHAPQGSQKFQSAKTVIVDECSMLTLVDLRVLLDTLDLGSVTRVILVGDPNQLPPIGVGRPFADICGFLATNEEEKLREAIATLTVEVRATNKERSDALRLAAWFTDHTPPVDADTVFSELAAKASLNDISISYWQDPEEIQDKIYEAFRVHLGFDPDDINGFNRAIGIYPDIDTLVQKATGIETFQVLSPVRGRIYGIDEINRRVQARYRRDQLRQGRSPFGVALGDQEIVLYDKVIQNRNQRRNSYPGKQKEFISNGEVGVVVESMEAIRERGICGPRRPDVRI